MATSPVSPSARPDPTSPWVISTLELSRQPGSMRRQQRTVTAPDDLGLEVMHVTPGSPIELDVRLEAVAEGVYVSGTALAELSGECARCLDPISEEVTVDVAELYAYPGRAGPEATDGTTDPDEVSRLVDEMADTEAVVRDAVLLALPLAPLCSPDCPGICPECGGRRAELGPDHSHDRMDPRWAALPGRPSDKP